jgi:glucose dehydrogenase
MRRPIVLLVAIASIVAVGVPAGAATPPAGTPREVARATRAWPTPNHDYANTRSTTTSPIRKRSVRDLDVAWAASPDGMGSLTTSPLILGQTIYLADANGTVFALDRASGDLRCMS